jgi:hypothetical protein
MTAPTDILKQADDARRDGRFADALTRLAPLLAAEFPPTGALVLAATCTRLHDAGSEGYGRAERYLRRALELDPASLDASLELAHLLHTIQSEPTPELKEVIARAAHLFERADISLTLLRVALLEDQRDWHAMHELLAPAVARHPQSTVLAKKLARLRKTLGLPPA